MLRGTLAFAITLSCTACATVSPSARGNLAKRDMQPTTNELEATIEAHVHENREGMAGATYERGASCGCN